MEDKLRINTLYLLALNTDRSLRTILGGFEKEKPFAEIFRVIAVLDKAVAAQMIWDNTSIIDNIIEDTIDFLRKYLV